MDILTAIVVRLMTNADVIAALIAVVVVWIILAIAFKKTK